VTEDCGVACTSFMNYPNEVQSAAAVGRSSDSIGSQITLLLPSSRMLSTSATLLGSAEGRIAPA
jgi:hypothetical protein